MNADRLLQLYERVSEAPDAIGRLRSLVLDLAIRGKLEPQDADEEPASELLHRIAMVRAEAPKSGRNSKKNLADASLTELPFELPSGWASALLSELVRVVNGRAYKKSELLEEGTPVLRVGNLFTSNHWYYSNLELDEDKYCEKDDLIYAWSASFGPFIWDGPRVIYHYHIWKLPLFSDSDLDKRFLYLFLQQKTRQIKEAGHGISMVHMTKGKMEQLTVPVPPLAEQKRIVAKVEELMALLDRLEAARAEREATRDHLTTASLTRLTAPDTDPADFPSHARFALDALPALTARSDQIKTLRQTLLDLAVRGKLVEQDPEDESASDLLVQLMSEKSGEEKKQPIAQEAGLVFSIPKHWKPICMAQALSELQTGPFGSSLHKSDYEVGGTPVINPASIQNRRIVSIDKMAVGTRTLDRLASFKLRAKDIVMARRGEMGRCAVVTEKEEGWLCGTGSLILRPRELLFPEYLALVISSPTGRGFLGGAAVGTTMQNLNQSILQKMPFGLPPLNEQMRIVDKVDELMALCDQLEATLTIADTNRTQLLEALLHEALSPSPGRQEVA